MEIAQRCTKCRWIDESDSSTGKAFRGVELCPLHSAAADLLAVAKEYADKIENNPDEGNFRVCCGVEYSYSTATETPHKEDCAAVAAIEKASRA